MYSFLCPRHLICLSKHHDMPKLWLLGFHCHLPALVKLHVTKSTCGFRSNKTKLFSSLYLLMVCLLSLLALLLKNKTCMTTFYLSKQPQYFALWCNGACIPVRCIKYKRSCVLSSGSGPRWRGSTTACAGIITSPIWLQCSTIYYAQRPLWMSLSHVTTTLSKPTR